MSERPLLIGRLAKLAGVKSDTVRFYERSGLLPKPLRTASAYRVYDDAALKQLRFIKKAQSLGFSLDEVGRILHLRGQGGRTCRAVRICINVFSPPGRPAAGFAKRYSAGKALAFRRSIRIECQAARADG